MKILVVHARRINDFPPVRNLIKILVRLGHQVTLITRNPNNAIIPEEDKVKLVILNEISHKWEYPKFKKDVCDAVDKHMRNNDILWTTTDSTVRCLGDRVLKYQHIMQLMELIEDIPLIPGVDAVGINIKKYAQKARAVVVPELNRAYILKTWWKLKYKPFVLPNKMDLEFEDKIPDEVVPILKNMAKEKRKIVLYQGVFTEDRKLENFAQAIRTCSDKYVLYIMGNDTLYRKKLCEMFPEIAYIPFVRPPYHLYITKNAHVGLLPYIAKRYAHYSSLNALYCAPNKIFEYAACGLPMIGSDVPGLYYPFMQYHIGYTTENQSSSEIASILERIDENYDEMVANCHSFYNSVDMDSIVSNILQESVNRES